MSETKETYPSEISREQFAIISSVLESGRSKTAPRHVDLYDVFNAILYLLREGCRWRSLPKKYLKWKLVYYYFCIWKEPRKEGPTLLEQALKKWSPNTGKPMAGKSRQAL